MSRRRGAVPPSPGQPIRGGSVRLAGALVAGALLAGCGLPQDDRPRALDPAEAPAGARASPSPVPDAVGDDRVALYFVRGGQVVSVTRPVPAPTSVEPLLELLLAGPTAAERAAGAGSVIPSSLSVQRVEQEGKTVVVTLQGAEDSARPEVLAFAQIVATLTPERASGVRFRLEEAALPVPRGDGQLTDLPVSRLDYANLLSPDGPLVVSPLPAPTAS